MIKITKEQLIEDIDNGLTYLDIQAKYGVVYCTVKEKLQKFNILKRPKQPDRRRVRTNDLELQVISLYKDGLSFAKIKEKLGVSQALSDACLKKHGIPKKEQRDRSYCKKLNIDYFEKIDTEEKAYFLGFLYADGYLSEDRGFVQLNLHPKDGYILHKFETLAGGENCVCSKRTVNATSLVFRSKKMVSDLKKVGLFQKKSLTLKFPESGMIPNELMPHFIRGYFDGDGCITYARSKKNGKSHKGNVNMIGSLYFINSLNSYLKDIISTSISIYRFKHAMETYRLSFCHLDSIKIFYEFLYKDATVFLTRKKEKFETFFSLKENDNPRGYYRQSC